MIAGVTKSNGKGTCLSVSGMDKVLIQSGRGLVGIAATVGANSAAAEVDVKSCKQEVG